MSHRGCCTSTSKLNSGLNTMSDQLDTFDRKLKEIGVPEFFRIHYIHTSFDFKTSMTTYFVYEKDKKYIFYNDDDVIDYCKKRIVTKSFTLADGMSFRKWIETLEKQNRCKCITGIFSE
jgi:hypothetical protein